MKLLLRGGRLVDPSQQLGAVDDSAETRAIISEVLAFLREALSVSPTMRAEIRAIIAFQRAAVDDRGLPADPRVPTALVVATAEAFGIVPFTTDRAHLDRYLQVIRPEIMPVSGRAPGIAITQAESLFTRAEMVVGQLVLVTGGEVPAGDVTVAGDWLRALVVDHENVSAWKEYADRIGARLTDETAIDAVIDDLNAEVADAVRDSDDAAEFALAPWLVGGAVLLWLFFFRRIRSS